MTHPEPHDLTALAYGLIEGDERDALLEHVADCDACREVYDSYRDEQVAVRDSILADARSGAAEAKALESTLRMLGAIEGEEEEPKKGKLIRMPRWLVAVEIAAALLVALGLFFILKPGDEPMDETMQVAEQDRAPAEVEQGVAYVQDNRGDWKQADAVPVDEWVKTGEQVFSFTLSDGSRTELEPNSVFRITLEDGNQPVVYLLHGNGQIDTTGAARQTYVRAGEAGFYTRPGAKLQMICEGEGTDRPRTWTLPETVKARVLAGNVMVWTDGELSHIPLQTGEEMYWDAQEGIRLEVAGELMRVMYAHETPFGGFPTQPEGGPDDPERVQIYRTGEMDEEVMKKLELFLPRLEEWDQHWEGDHKQWKGEHKKRMNELRLELEQMRIRLKQELGEEGDIRVRVVPDNVIQDKTVLVFPELGMTIILSSDGEQLTIDVRTPDGATTHSASSLKKLKESLKPEIAKLLEGVSTERDDDGYLRIVGYSNTTGQKVDITQKSQRRSSNNSDD